MKNTKFRVWDNTSSDIGGQTMLEWESVHNLVEHGIFLTDILSGVYDYLTPLEFTGKRDRNGVEIYDQSVVKIFGTPCLTLWSNTDSCFNLHRLDVPSTPERLGTYLPTALEVIGDSFNNPDLVSTWRV